MGDRGHGERIVDEVMAAVSAADPAVRFVLPRVLRRVIKRDRRIQGALLQVPHRKSLVVERDRLLAHVRREELRGGGADVPGLVILLPVPTLRQVRSRGRPGCLRHWWRLLFHARVHAVFEAPDAVARYTHAALRARIDRIGQTVFDEARRVLLQEHFLLPPRSPLGEYAEFAALFLELRAFAPELLPRYFPDVEDPERIAAVFADDFDAGALLAWTRPAGAPDAVEEEPAEAGPGARKRRGRRLRRTRPDRDAEAIRVQADRRRARGNVVRAAILRQRADMGPILPESAEPSPDARRDVERLVVRLRDAIGFGKAEADAWHDALCALLPVAAAGFRAPEARLLYDLQKVCLDHERGVHAVDLWRWMLSGGARPLRRALPWHRDILVGRHLRAARARLPRLHLPEGRLAELDRLLGAGVEHAERQLRSKARPAVAGVLDEVGFVPRNVAETVARRKLVEELCDRVVEHGFLNLGDVRDAVARNQLKLADCEGFKDFWSADHLLSADRAFDRRLEGVYRPAEVYIRWLQRVSAALFGTEEGRIITRHFIIPFGGAFMVLEGLNHMVNPGLRALAGVTVPWVTPWSLLGCGWWFWGLVHRPRVRARSAAFFKSIGRGARWLFWRLPRRILALPAVRAFVESRPVRIAARYVLRPALLAGLLWTPLTFAPAAPRSLIIVAGALFLAANVFLNSPLGLAVEEWTIDWAGRSWDRVKTRLLAGLVRAVIQAFKRATELFERMLYAVDEWLRFRSGEGKLSLAFKAVVGVVWRGVDYVTRIYVTLLIEPTVNPIKHFPVVTVTHKMIIPLYPMLGTALTTAFSPLGAILSWALTGFTIFVLPGFFGFLVWEFKENWKLYAASRAPKLRPALVGSHGETMLRLMKPGFHSGTLPKLYARLRRRERKLDFEFRPGARRKLLDAIHHVEEAVARFVERDLLAQIGESRAFAGRTFAVAAVDAGSNRIRVSIASDLDRGRDLELAFDEQSGFVVAGIHRPGWLDGLSPAEGEVFRAALLGLYMAAGVDLVREHVERQLGAPPPPYDVADDGLRVWPGPGYEREEVHVLVPPVPPGARDGRRLLLAHRTVRWDEWEAAWEAERAGRPLPPLAADIVLLPQI